MKSKTILVLAISFAFILGTMIAGSEGAFAAKDDAKKTEKKEKKEKKVIILYKSDETDKKDEKGKKHKDKEKHVEKLKEKNAKIKYVYDIIPGIAATIDEDSIIDLMNDEDVLAVVDDAEVYAHLQFSIPQINADDVHAAGITGAGVNVCVVDTGVDDSHPALNSVIAEYDFINNDSDATDDHYHGTHVAGIVASIDSTYKGVAPGASLMAAKVLGSTGSGTISGVIQGIDWCVANGADIITMSLGYGLFAGTCDTLDAIASNNAVAAGVVVIASSGNNGSTNGMGSPSCGSDVISVGAVSQTDVRAGFSNGSTELDVVAPGVSIQSLNLGGSGYRTLSGTSMAAPHVAGTVALMLEKNSELTPDEIRTILHESSVDLGSPGFDNLYGYGRINAQAAVDMDFETPPIPPLPPLPTQNLFVSAENSLFDNYMSGPQVIEIVIIDSDINDTDEAWGEPDVTVNGKELRMVQAVDGNWYAYFADKIMAETADTTSVIAGEGLDFGTFCNPDVTIGGSITGIVVSFDDTAGVAFPLAVGSGSGSTDNTVPGFGSCNVNISGVTTIPNNVVREAKEPNPSFIDPDFGPVGVGQIDIDVNAWPFIQLYNLNPTGIVVVQYNKGGGAQVTTLTFDTVENFAGLELDRTPYPQSAQVHVTVTDVWLNIDPTDEDSWTFGTTSYPYGDPSTNYQVFDENGFAVGDTPTNTDANLLTAALSDLMCDDNCILVINTNAQQVTNPVLTLSDNDDSEILGANPNDALSFKTAGGNLDGKVPVTITELSPNSGIFGTYDEQDNSILRITNNAWRGTSATIDYNDTPFSIVVGFGFASIDIQALDAEWNSGEEIPIVLVDIDANKNSRQDEDLDLDDPNVELIPALQTGNPFTLNSLIDVQLSGNSLTIDEVQRFSERAMLTSNSDFSFQSGDRLVLTQSDTFADLYDSINEPDTAFRGFNFFNYDIRSIDNNLDNTINSFSVDITDGTNTARLGNNISSMQGFFDISDASDDVFAMNTASKVQIIFTFDTSDSSQILAGTTMPIVVDFFSFGFLNDGLLSSERIANQIIRIEVEESGDNTGTFEGALEFLMLNQINILAETSSPYPTIEDVLNPINEEVVFIVIEDLTDEDSPRVNYFDLGADGIPTQISHQEEAPTHSGIISLDRDTYKEYDTVNVTLEDKDLDTDPDLIEVYVVVDYGDIASDTIGHAGLPELSFGPLGKMVYFTFDDELWSSGLIENGGSCNQAGILDDGLFETGFTLIETSADSGVFQGNFIVPETFCEQSSGNILNTGNADLDVNYVDFRDASGEIITVGDSAGILGARSIDVTTDLSEYIIGQTLHISGTVTSDYFLNSPITISVTNPENTLLTISQTSHLSDGTYSLQLKISNPLWSTLGTYTVNVSYPYVEASTTFEVANGFVLSKNSDFTTDDREFETSNTLHILASTDTVDTSNMKKAEFKIEDSERNRLKGKLDFNPDGSFTSSVSLADLNPGTVKVELKLEDNNKNKFNVKENIIILEPPSTITLPLTIGDVSVDEDVDVGYASIPVTWDPSHPAFVGLDKFTFAVRTSDGTAIEGNDYQSINYILISNPTLGIIQIAAYIIDDTTFESDETFTITLTDPNADDATIDTSTVTIIDNDPQPPVEEFFALSKNSDFSTEDREFETSDILYMLTTSNLVDYSNMKKAEFKIQDSKKVKLQGTLILGADGIFTSSVSLADLNPGTAKVELKLEDKNRNKFNVKENITIS